MSTDTTNLNLRIHEYCVDDDTITVEGVAPHALDLPALAEVGRKLTSKVMLMERLNVLYIVMNSVTIHLHENGEIMVNRVKSLKEAEKILENLIIPSPINTSGRGGK